MFRLSLFLVLFVATNAFQASLPLRQQVKHVSSTSRPVLLSEDETKAILQSADECAAGECSVDDVAELVYELKEQQQLMEARLEAVMNAVSHLQHLNEKAQDDDKKRDEVKAMVQDLLRVFSTEKAAFPISGFSGDFSKKTLTAYDALPPKKIKKT